MRRIVSFALLAALLPAAGLVRTAQAEEPKTLVVLSLSSHDEVTGDIASVAKIADSPDSPGWLVATLKLFSEGADLNNLDSSRPSGAVVRLDQELSAYAFIPVRDAEQLSWELSEFIDVVGNDGEVYEIVGKETGKRLYAKESGGWLFVSDNAETLRTVPENPATLLGGLNKQYDVALRFELHNVPAEHGKKLLAKLDQKLGPVVRDVATDKTVDNIGEALYALDQVTLGWSRHVAK
ncbi:MAG: hypothetical protein ACC645_07005 [Pirellulales bacterium]